MPRWKWLLVQFTRRLWVRASLIGALGIMAAILAAVVERYLPFDMPASIGAEAVDSILGIIASSMLTVTTFSLSVAVSAYASATSNVTPRATKLLVEDRLTQNVLSTFLGSFLFGIVGIVVLQTGAYGERGRFILFAVTVLVIGLVVISLLRWIDHLTRLGRVGETTDRVEEATRQAMEARLTEPYLGGRPLMDPDAEIPESALAITATVIGYVQHIDMQALSHVCGENEASIYVMAIPGTFVFPHTPIAWIVAGGKELDPAQMKEAICDAFSIDDERSFDQDPRFGLAVMTEIAQRALSPAVNDPGTAIDVIGRSARLLSIWTREIEDEGRDEPTHPDVHVRPLATADLFEDAFMALARDGAGMIEVQLRLQKALLSLRRMGDEEFRAAAANQSRMALSRAEAVLTLEDDKARLRKLVAENGVEGARAGGAQQ